MDRHNAAILNLLQTSEPPALDSTPRKGTLSILEIQKLLDVQVVFFTPEANILIQCAVMIWHDHMDPAHELAQAVETADGSYLHGIIHRREPDYSNARYWFNRVGQYPIYPRLKSQAADLLQFGPDNALMARLAPKDHWDPYAFIDACATVVRVPKSDPAQVVRQVQAIELRTLLEHFMERKSRP